MIKAEEWIDREQWHETGDKEIVIQLKQVQADALRDAAAMNCANHVPACNCDVCAFTKRILTAAQTLEAPAAQPNVRISHAGE
jgi:hypothetical protein